MQTATVSKWGNSLGVRLPEAVANMMGISAGDKVEFTIQGDTMLVKKAESASRCRKYLEAFYGTSYDELLKTGMEEEELLDWGEDAGDEVIE